MSQHVQLGKVNNCSVSCLLTNDLQKWDYADAIVFDALYMAPIKARSIDKSKKRINQKWLFNFDFEPPIYNGKLLAKRLVQTLDPLIDWTFTFNPRGDFHKPHWGLAPHAEDATVFATNWAENKNRILLWFSSHGCGSNFKRNEVFKKLSSYLPDGSVDLFGGCGKRDPCGGRGSITNPKAPKDCVQRLAKSYKFYAAFENSRCRGYTTEKLRTGLVYGMVPIAYGGMDRSDYELIVPADSFIHVDDFTSLENLAKFMLELDKDEALK